MKNKDAITAILAVTMSICGLAFAEDDGYRRDSGRHGQSQRAGQQERRDHNARRPLPPQFQGRPHNNMQGDERGAGPDHGFYRGEHLPSHYRSRQYRVDDWRGHRLSEPPRGYYWAQTGSDYVLVAIATGVILQILLNN